MPFSPAAYALAPIAWALVWPTPTRGFAGNESAARPAAVTASTNSLVLTTNDCTSKYSFGSIKSLIDAAGSMMLFTIASPFARATSASPLK